MFLVIQLSEIMIYLNTHINGEIRKRYCGAAFKEFGTIKQEFKDTTKPDKSGNLTNKSRIYKINGKWLVGRNQKEMWIDGLKLRSKNFNN